MAVLKNARHERFAQELAKGETATAAYKLAGYTGTDHIAQVNGSRLLLNDMVQARVAELKERSAVRAEVTIASIAEQLDADRALAHKVKQPGAAVSASIAKAKLFGLVQDRHEHVGKGGGAIQTEELTQYSTRDIAKALCAIFAMAEAENENAE